MAATKVVRPRSDRGSSYTDKDQSEETDWALISAITFKFVHEDYNYTTRHIVASSTSKTAPVTQVSCNYVPFMVPFHFPFHHSFPYSIPVIRDTHAYSAVSLQPTVTKEEAEVGEIVQGSFPQYCECNSHYIISRSM